MKNKFLLLFADCRIVQGYKNSIIYDLTRLNNSNFIPTSLIEFIRMCEKHSINEVLNQYDEGDRKTALSYIDFILEREYGFLADSHVKKNLGKLDLSYNDPSVVHNSIVCLNKSTVSSFSAIQQQLDELLCVNLELRLVDLSISDLNNVFKCIADSVLESVLVRLNFSSIYTEDTIKKILIKHKRIKHIYVYHSPRNSIGENYTYLTKKVDFIRDCGIINKTRFVINQQFFIESQSCNTCLNKKISVDFNGEIKNCPSQNKSFGNVDSISLLKVIQKADFLSLGKIKKDQIAICKDCEYRHMCLDCRVFIDNPTDSFSHPSKCKYNPYLGKWSSEEGYVTVQQFLKEKLIN